MKRKLLFIILILSLFSAIVYTSYSYYADKYTVEGKYQIAKWHVLANGVRMTHEHLELEPVIHFYSGTDVLVNRIAPRKLWRFRN